MTFTTENPSAMHSQDNSLLLVTPEKEKVAAAAVRKKKLLFIGASLLGAVILIGATLGILVSQNVIGSSHSKSASASSSASASASVSHSATSTASHSAKSTASGASPSSTSTLGTHNTRKDCAKITNVPDDVKGTYLDMTTWKSSLDFNCTWTNETVGGLPIAGLNSTWDDSAQANPQVPALNTPWGPYTIQPARGVNIGGWLSLEPFITPSLFNYPDSAGVVDEYTLTQHLGSNASTVLEEHYASFITESDFAAIAAAGLDHVRIPFSYWAVTTYDGDPYVKGISWRYLLRGIEWARKYGLRVNLDFHALPGSQNGWNHSGHLAKINWILGNSGDTNRQRSLDIHAQLAAFFSQERYKNIIVFYGLANEPGPSIPTNDLQRWITDAYTIIKNAGYNGIQVISDGLRDVNSWKGRFDGYGDSLSIDTHMYAIFTKPLLSLTRKEKISCACNTFRNTLTGFLTSFGPTIAGEFSAADNDCTKHLNGLNSGSRWDGSFTSNAGQQWCPTEDSQCTCSVINGGVDGWDDLYIKFLKAFSYAQMDTYERTWGWFYWTWKTESAPLFSYKVGIEKGFLPEKAYKRDWNCSSGYPDLGGLPESK